MSKTTKPRSRQAIADYLMGHERYHTMNSWNRSTSYSRNIKLSHIDLPKEIQDTAYDIVYAGNYLDETGFSGPLDKFQRDNGHHWQWGTNGRSSGYVVLYQGKVEPTEHKSCCQNCGQLNFASVETRAKEGDTAAQLREYVLTHNHWVPSVYPGQSEVKALGLSDEAVIEAVKKIQASFGGAKPNITFHNKCGRCHELARTNLTEPHMSISCYTGRGTDDDVDFYDAELWEFYELKSKLDIVWAFDKAVDQGIANFIEFCRTHKVVDEEIQVTKKIKAIVEC